MNSKEQNPSDLVLDFKELQKETWKFYTEDFFFVQNLPEYLLASYCDSDNKELIKESWELHSQYFIIAEILPQKLTTTTEEEERGLLHFQLSARRPTYLVRKKNCKTLANRKMIHGYLNGSPNVTDMRVTTQQMLERVANNNGNFKLYPTPRLPPYKIANDQLPKLDYNKNIIQTAPSGRFLKPTNGIRSIAGELDVFHDFSKEGAKQSHLLCQYTGQMMSSNSHNEKNSSSLVDRNKRATSPRSMPYYIPSMLNHPKHDVIPASRNPPSNRLQTSGNISSHGLTLPKAIMHSSSVNFSHSQDTRAMPQASMNEAVVYKTDCLPKQQSEQIVPTAEFPIKRASFQQECGIAEQQSNGNQSSAVPCPNPKEVLFCRGPSREKPANTKRPRFKRGPKKTVCKMPATQVKKGASLSMISQVQPKEDLQFQPSEVRLEELKTKRENIRKKLKEFLCEDAKCNDKTCSLARKYHFHAINCRNWYTDNKCGLCGYICSTIYHAEICEDFLCGSIFCKSKQAVVIAESFSDSVFVRGFLQQLGASEEDISETYVIQNLSS